MSQEDASCMCCIGTGRKTKKASSDILRSRKKSTYKNSEVPSTPVVLKPVEEQPKVADSHKPSSVLPQSQLFEQVNYPSSGSSEINNMYKPASVLESGADKLKSSSNYYNPTSAIESNADKLRHAEEQRLRQLNAEKERLLAEKQQKEAQHQRQLQRKLQQEKQAQLDRLKLEESQRKNELSREQLERKRKEESKIYLQKLKLRGVSDVKAFHLGGKVVKEDVVLRIA